MDFANTWLENMVKRLLCIVSSLNAGGAETFLMKNFREMDRSVYRLDFIVSENTNGIYEDEVRKLGGKIYEIPLRTKKPITAFIRIREIVKKNKYRYVLKMADTPKGITDVLAAKAGGAQIVSVRSCNSSAGETRLKKAIYSLIRPLFVRAADRMIAPSKLAAEYTFGKNQIKNVFILHNAINLNCYTFDEQKAKEIKKVLSIKDRPVVGHVGRFTEQKNHKFLLRVFAEIKKEKPETVLVLVGEGPLEENLKKDTLKYGLKNSVIFYGVTENISEVMSVFDVMVFPSLYEGLPNVIVEAQCIGIPCLISSKITDEVKLTELVHRIPLEKGEKVWAKKALDLLNIPIRSGKKELADCGYDIKKEISRFIRVTMEETDVRDGQ